MEIHLGDTWKIEVVCPECGGPMSSNAFLCRSCYKRAGGRKAAIYKAAKDRGEASDRSTRRPEDVPPRVYHKRGDQTR
jgi:tRNA(Ile2) C34 agmatinyltransferase TiaS